jgi:hypothetical protein
VPLGKIPAGPPVIRRIMDGCSKYD